MFSCLRMALPKKTFYILLVKILNLEKKQVISALVCLSLFFQEKMLLMKRRLGGQEEGL